VISASPERMTKFPPGGDFDGKWILKNVGTNTWNKNDIDFLYISGEKFQKSVDIIDLPETVKPGKQIKIIIDMLAPKETGTYTSNWALARSSFTFCVVSVIIQVVK
jgi:hypothetical protein